MKSVLILFALLVANIATAEIVVKDDRGDTVQLEQPAQRIVSLAPHVTELLFAAGAGDSVVGAVNYSDYPPAAEAVPRVGGYKALDLEAIVATKPDLVVAWHSGNGTPAIEKLRGLGLTVYVSEPRVLEDVATSLERLGRLAGRPQVAEVAARRFREHRDRLAATFGDQPPVSVFYQIWNQPLMTINGEHLISQVMALCGGRNVFADLSALAPSLSLEAVLIADPQAIVASGMGEERPEWLDDWRRWPTLQAVKNNHLFFVPPELIQRHSPRILQGADRLCEALAQVRRENP